MTEPMVWLCLGALMVQGALFLTRGAAAYPFLGAYRVQLELSVRTTLRNQRLAALVAGAARLPMTVVTRDYSDAYWLNNVCCQSARIQPPNPLLIKPLSDLHRSRDWQGASSRRQETPTAEGVSYRVQTGRVAYGRFIGFGFRLWDTGLGGLCPVGEAHQGVEGEGHP